MSAPTDSQGLRFAAIGGGALALGAIAWFFLRPKEIAPPAAPPAPSDEKPPAAAPPGQAPGYNALPDYAADYYVERWQLLPNNVWVGPEWFPESAEKSYKELQRLADPIPPRPDALYIYRRTWFGADRGIDGWDWSLTAWKRTSTKTSAKKPPPPQAPPSPPGELPPPIPQTPQGAPNPADYHKYWLERWQFLRDETWSGPEWFYLPLMNPADDPPRVDALYVYTREWTPVDTSKPVGLPLDKDTKWKTSPWKIT